MSTALGSYSNTPFASSVDCICCHQPLEEAQEHCSYCQTPAKLSQAVASRGGAHHFVSVLGASNAGKTVYLGLLLDILSKGSPSFHAAANSPFSVDLQQQVVTALERRRFPEKTPSEADAWKWLHCELIVAAKKATRSVDLISPDFAGEAIAMEVNHAGMYPAISGVVSQSSGLLMLCDSMQVRDAGCGEDLFAMKLASYIAGLHGLTEQNRRGVSGPAVAIVFTKCDGCPEAIENPTAFAQDNTPRLSEFCRRAFPKHAFFAASVAGSSGVLGDAQGRQSRVPFHIRPHGIVEPLRWIVDHC